LDDKIDAYINDFNYWGAKSIARLDLLAKLKKRQAIQSTPVCVQAKGELTST